MNHLAYTHVMRPALLIVSLLILSNCMPKLVPREEELPVYPRDNLYPALKDTTLTGTIVMLSDKQAAFDVVEVVGDSAFRRARFIFDRPVHPYCGGAIRAHVNVLETGVTGYMIRGRLLDWEEIPLARSVTARCVETNLKKFHARLERFVREHGIDAWEPDGILTIEGYDPRKKIAIYSMAGRTTNLMYAEKQPLLIVWAYESGKIQKIYLTVIIRRLERS